MLKFLADNNYPSPWTKENLEKYCLRVALKEDGETIGYAWGHWTQGRPNVLWFHVCVSPEWRGRWLSRRILSDLSKIAEFLGAEKLMTEPTGPDEKLVRTVLKRLGFKADGPYMEIELGVL